MFKVTLTPKEFGQLKSKEQYCYRPVYGKYKTVKKKILTECDECGNKRKEIVEKEIPIGKPIEYHFSTITTADKILPIIWERLLKKEAKWKLQKLSALLKRR